jgi:hypothetical protein
LISTANIARSAAQSRQAWIHARRAEVAVVFVDVNRPGVKVIDRQSPVVKQYNLPSAPQSKVFGPDGKLMAEGRSACQRVTG